MSGNLSFDVISSTLGNTSIRAESTLASRIASLGDSPSTTDLLLMQSEITKWTLTNELTSTLMKSVGDSLKGIVQKSA
jgi:type III secretion protein F